MGRHAERERELDGESLRLILYLKDGTNLRVTEQWSEKTLKRYNLKIG
ncbi:MAG: hypothetical protein Q7J31_15370 [Syntrophales bacterium]|nr:hypothetical protein [Syntrophales bacterium]